MEKEKNDSSLLKKQRKRWKRRIVFLVEHSWNVFLLSNVCRHVMKYVSKLTKNIARWFLLIFIRENIQDPTIVVTERKTSIVIDEQIVDIGESLIRLAIFTS